ncbi:Crp/Fnr family transcriptional regulator [Salinarimonas soli]|uniref:Crp/Fnr family transcriptional regulator n=1 Tax=Salinarimonas soli TaxID=1638099 RepID=A0A5B2VC84_9HYPH|nr:Crp/Fnr family transcriptional regulator [Salinarimonas soli]KAA2236022.1 Crp/Fnr family transcriptional regulator [Salinarimonas soli]
MIGAVAPARVKTLARGDALFRQGDPATAIFRVVAGRLRLERRTSDGRPVVLHTARAGELFAEASLFADAYHCDAVAVTDAVVGLYDKAALLASLGAGAQAGGLIATMARQLQECRGRLELRNVRSARERVLLWLDLRGGPAGIVAVEGELQDIAAELGLTREAFYRTLAALERDGLISRDGTRITLRRRVSP